MAVELATAYISLVPSAKGITAGIQKEMGAPLVAAGKTSGAKSSTAFGAAFKSGIKTAAIGVGVIAGVAAIGKSFEDAFNTIERGTGATGKTLEGLNQSFRNVLKNGSGSFDQVSAAITKLFQRTGLTGKALEDFAAKEVSLARITKTDVAANLESTTALFNLYGVAAEHQSDKLDVLFKASQLAGVSITQLAADMQSAAPTAKILGLNIDQTAALVANLDKAGLPASRVMLGLASSFAKAAKQGREPIAVIKDLVKQVKEAPTATDAARIAVQRFGISARAASVLVAGIRSGAVDLTKSLDGGKGILATAAATATLSGKLARLKNEALVGLEPLATAALGALLKGVTLAIPVVAVLTEHMNILGPALVAAAAGFAAFKVAVGIQAIITGLATAFTAMKVAVLGTADAELAATVASKGLLASIGPIGFIAAAIGATLAVVTLKTSLFGKEQKDAGKATNDLIASLLDEGKTLDDVAGKIIVKAIRDNARLGDTFKAANVPLKSVNEALLGNKTALGDVVRGLGAADKAGKISTINFIEAGEFIEKNTKSLQDQSDAKHRATSASKELAGAESGAAGAAKTAALAQDQLRIAATNLTTAIINNADRLRGLQEGLIGVFQSAINLKQGLTDIAEKQAVYDKFVKAGTQNTKDGVQALQELQLARLGQLQSTAQAVDSTAKFADSTSHLSDAVKTQTAAQEALSKATSDFNSGKGSPEAIADAQRDLDKATGQVAKSQDAFRAAILAVAGRVSGPLHDALIAYAGQIANLPPTKPTEIKTPGLDTASINLHDYRDEMGKLPGVKHTKIDLDADKALTDLFTLKSRISQLPSNVPFTAVVRGEGGRIPGGAHGLVATAPMLAVIGENAGTTPEIVSPVALMAATFKAELDKAGSGSRKASVVFTGPIQSWDDKDLARRLDERVRRAELLAGV